MANLLPKKVENTYLNLHGKNLILTVVFETFLEIYSKASGMKHSISPHKFRHFLFTWLKKQGTEDAMIQPYSGHKSRQSLEIYSKLSIGDAQENYENVIIKFPV